jgi:flavin reductase (DIM6/NTAB) family NADH-FMN oxidoreductase RutF
MKINIGQQTFVLPMAQTILGCHLNGRPNFMALGWVSRVNAKPPMLGVGVNKRNQSHDAISASGEFSVNFPSADMVAVTDYTGLVSGKRVDKSELFELFYGELKAAPMIKACPLTIECKLYQQVELPTNSFFIGEILDAYSEERYLTDGTLDIKKANPFVLTMPDNRYWSIGECIGHAWKDGKALK